MPKVNYKHEKRQKDIEKKKKHDEKLQRRQKKKETPPLETPAVQPKEKSETPQ